MKIYFNSRKLKVVSQKLYFYIYKEMLKLKKSKFNKEFGFFITILVKNKAIFLLLNDCFVPRNDEMVYIMPGIPPP